MHMGHRRLQITMTTGHFREAGHFREKALQKMLRLIYSYFKKGCSCDP